MGEQNTFISAIAAVSSNGMIGNNGGLPWDIPEDVAYFEAMIAGAALVVGRLTYATMTAFPEDTFVVSQSQGIDLKPGSYRMDSVEKALSTAQATGKPVFVIGGAGIYEAAWPYCRYFYLTRIERSFAGDTPFPQAIQLDRCSLLEAREETFRDRSSGEDVLCRFLKYEQKSHGCCVEK